ncbi:thioesterase domain-containing protein [Pseudomonas sp. NA13]
MPNHIELCLLQLPGRNARLREKSYTRMEELVTKLTPDLIPYLDRPFAFFGLCLGGVQAFEVAQRLVNVHNLHPTHLIFAGSRAPHFYNEHQFASDVLQFNYESDREPAVSDDGELIAMLKEMNFANNQALFDDAEMRDLMLPIIKADYEINNTYLYETSPRLEVPITSIGGRIDPTPRAFTSPAGVSIRLMRSSRCSVRGPLLRGRAARSDSQYRGGNPRHFLQFKNSHSAETVHQ